jgi:tetratricopeptide (TPR) repeat protein
MAKHLLFSRQIAMAKLFHCSMRPSLFMIRALGIDPDYLDALNNKALSLLDLERTEEAIDVYDKALSIAPNDVAALNSKGLALLDLGIQ